MNISGYHKIYFIGIGGIGMSAIARYFLHKGYDVAGYDLSPSAITKELAELGANIHYTDNTALIPESFTSKTETLVVYTPAIPDSHSELAYFIGNGFKTIKRAVALGAIASNHKTFAVAGTHGKTSTSSLLAHLLAQAEPGCDAFLGGIARNFNSNLVLQSRSGNILVVEADEFDRSFLQLFPNLAIITSIDADHLDIYGSYQSVEEAFNRFIDQINTNGTLITKEGVNVMLPTGKPIRHLRYGLTAQSHYYPKDVTLHNGIYHFTLHTPTADIPKLELGTPGLFYLENAIAASAAALQAGISAYELRNALRSFKGVARRFDIRFRSRTTVYIDDYAHHPKEIESTIRSIRELFPKRKITGIFQPHLYSRTRDFADEFAASLDQLDQTLLLDIYPAREKPIEGISAETILRKMKNPNRALLDKSALLEWIDNHNSEILVTMGAGDIDKLVPEIEKHLKRRTNG